MKNLLVPIMLKLRNKKNGYIDANVIYDFQLCCDYFGSDKFRNDENIINGKKNMKTLKKNKRNYIKPDKLSRE